MKNILIASNNKGKINEFSEILSKYGYMIKSMKDMGFHEDIEETGLTLRDNALIKAKTLYERYGMATISDDSGLFIEALDGAPGVYSARYAGEHGNNKDNIDKVLKEMQDEQNRKAYFACVLCLAIEEQFYFFEGRVHGQITQKIEGERGFGYDPIFIPEGYSESFGNLSTGIKNKISHRAKALDHLMEFFEQSNS